jgi:hypothetical protein
MNTQLFSQLDVQKERDRWRMGREWNLGTFYLTNLFLLSQILVVLLIDQRVVQVYHSFKTILNNLKLNITTRLYGIIDLKPHSLTKIQLN